MLSMNKHAPSYILAHKFVYKLIKKRLHKLVRAQGLQAQMFLHIVQLRRKCTLYTVLLFQGQVIMKEFISSKNVFDSTFDHLQISS